MSTQATEELFAKLEQLGEDSVRLKVAQGVYAPKRKLDLVLYWLAEKEKAKNKRDNESTLGRTLVSNTSKDIWTAIQSDFDISKRSFAKKINFVRDEFKRKILFRDIEHAYALANQGFPKPAVILAGGVIEEILRLYLESRGIRPQNNSFNSYIISCEQNGLIKSAIHRLTDSVRHFRNLVHLGAESTPRFTISKATAKGAVSSIFTIVNDL